MRAPKVTAPRKRAAQINNPTCRRKIYTLQYFYVKSGMSIAHSAKLLFSGLAKRADHGVGDIAVAANGDGGTAPDDDRAAGLHLLRRLGCRDWFNIRKNRRRACSPIDAPRIARALARWGHFGRAACLHPLFYSIAQRGRGRPAGGLSRPRFLLADVGGYAAIRRCAQKPAITRLLPPQRNLVCYWGIRAERFIDTRGTGIRRPERPAVP